MRLTKTICEVDKCVGCLACQNVCPTDAITLVDSRKQLNCYIDSDKCIDCHKCYNHCQQINTEFQKNRPLDWYQGWFDDLEHRSSSASGGIAFGIAKSFIENGNYVCTCVFDKGEFCYSIIDNVVSLRKAQGSKYVKSTPGTVYTEVLQLLRLKFKVLFIGLPCHFAALLLLCSETEKKYLYTIDLICHGSPSALLLEDYISQYGYSLKEITDIRFRIKKGAVPNQGSIGSPKAKDQFTYSFLNGIIYTENCYSCAYASLYRCTDLTIGDSWGTTLNEEELSKGLSLVLCQTAKGKYLLENSNLRLFDVNIDSAITNNEQLRHPTNRPDNRDTFFKLLDAGHSFNYSFFFANPKAAVKLSLKAFLLKLNLVNRDPEIFHLYIYK